MQTLSGTLATAQGRMDVLPVVSAVIGDLPPEAPRLSELVSQYAGTEPDSPFDASYSDDGTILRCRLTAGVMSVQIVDPAAPTWSTWTVLDNAAGNWGGTNQCAVLGKLSTRVPGAFWVAGDGHTVRWSYFSAGAWVAATTVYDRGAGFLVSGLACCANEFTTRLYGVTASNELWETHWNGSVWSAPASDGGTWPSSTLSASFRPATAPGGDGDGWIVVCAYATTAIRLKQFKITSGSGWTAGDTLLLQSGVVGGYSYRYPHFSEARSDSSRACLTWSEVAPAPIGTAAMVCFTPTHGRITGVLPWRYSGAFGVKVFRDTTAAPKWWFTSANQVYAVIADTGLVTGQRLSLDSTQIAGFAIDTSRTNHPSTASLTILNPDGVYKDAGLAGAHQCLRPWSQVAISCGYRTSAGAEVVRQIPLWIEAITFHDEPRVGTPLVTLHLVDAWGILERLRYRSTITYLAQTPEWLLDGILWQVCGVLAGTGNARLGAFTLATFTVRAGEVLAVVARRLLDLGAVTLLFRPLANADGIGLDSVGVVGISQRSGASVYSYGGAGQHPIVRSEIAPLVAPAATAVEVSGLTTFSLVRNWTHAWLLWRDIQVRVVDKSLSVQASTDAVATNRATIYLSEGQGGSVLVLANVAQEIEDQITLTVATAPIAGVKYTVVGARLTYELSTSASGGAGVGASHGRLLQLLRLEGAN